jgi:hypothetical protein
MASSVTWLDHSEHERKRALDVISLFREQGTIDELGIGTVRDAFADLFFPGISTIQTRAAYFLFVPWMYAKLEHDISSSWSYEEIIRRARTREIDLIGPMIRNDQIDGLIGREARNRLQRLPSTIYWGGLRTFGVLWYPGSQEAYHRTLALGRGERGGLTRDDDGEPLAGESAPNWDPHLPPVREGFPSEAPAFALSRGEARYLRDRLSDPSNESVRGSLLAWLVTHTQSETDIDLPWHHPHLADMPGGLQELLEHARCFSEVMHGAQLLYNLAVAEGTERDDWVEIYELALDGWADDVIAGSASLRSWAAQRPRFRQLTSTAGSRPSRDMFVDAWIEIALSGRTGGRVRRDDRARRLVRDREITLKGPRARLALQGSTREWGGQSGAAQLSYRWPNTQRILNDIFRGLRRRA